MSINEDRSSCYRLACISAAASICLGAFGAHSLKNSGIDPARLKVPSTNNYYGFAMTNISAIELGNCIIISSYTFVSIVERFIISEIFTQCSWMFLVWNFSVQWLIISSNSD